MVAAKDLEKENIRTVVVNCHTIKPIDENLIVEVAKKCGAVVTVEEHQVMGGLGGAVAEVLSKSHPTAMEFVGMQNTFGESGPPKDLVEKYGMSAPSIIESVRRVINRK